jgi:RNA polymerase sigma factor (sigma-70 family)
MADAAGDPRELDESRPPSPEVVRVWASNHRAFLAFLERRVGDRAAAEDILQEAFVRGLNKGDTLRDEDSAVAWFYRMLRNAVTDYHRRRGSSGRALAAFACELETQVEPDPETQGSICQCVSEIAGTLKPEYADALRRIEVEGVPVQQFASEVGISSSNAGVRVFRAREALRKQVARACGTCAEHGCLDCTCGKPRGPEG